MRRLPLRSLTAAVALADPPGGLLVLGAFDGRAWFVIGRRAI